MSKRPEPPVSRLICFGGAKAHTNASGGVEIPEDDVGDYYNP